MSSHADSSRSAAARLGAAIHSVPLPNFNSPPPTHSPARHPATAPAHHGAPSTHLARTSAHPGAPDCTPAHHQSPISQNKAACQNVPLPAHHSAPSSPPSQRTAAHQRAPQCTPAHPQNAISRNEPTGQIDAPSIRNPHLQSIVSPTLTPQQLAALRYLLAGHRPTLVARALHIDRHTLLRWRRSPEFQAQFPRLHLQLLAKATAPPNRPAQARPAPARISPDDILARYGYRPP